MKSTELQSQRQVQPPPPPPPQDEPCLTAGWRCRRADFFFYIWRQEIKGKIPLKCCKAVDRGYWMVLHRWLHYLLCFSFLLVSVPQYFAVLSFLNQSRWSKKGKKHTETKNLYLYSQEINQNTEQLRETLRFEWENILLTRLTSLFCFSCFRYQAGCNSLTPGGSRSALQK